MTQEAHGRRDTDWFDEYFEVLDHDDTGERLKTGDIYQTLRENGYPHSSKHLGQWMKKHFRGHASVYTVDHHGTKKWVCIERKDGA